MTFFVIEKCAKVKLICEDMIGYQMRNTYWICEVIEPAPHFAAGEQIHIGVNVIKRAIPITYR